MARPSESGYHNTRSSVEDDVDIGNQTKGIFQDSAFRYVRYWISLTSNLSQQLQPVIKNLDQTIGKVNLPSSSQFESVRTTID
jgi:hypothetical protein